MKINQSVGPHFSVMGRWWFVHITALKIWVDWKQNMVSQSRQVNSHILKTYDLERKIFCPTSLKHKRNKQ